MCSKTDGDDNDITIVYL
jgi:hypothetical protein